jgi:hypothetical protein
MIEARRWARESLEAVQMCKGGKVKKWGKVKSSGLVDKWTGGRGETNNSGRVGEWTGERQRAGGERWG